MFLKLGDITNHGGTFFICRSDRLNDMNLGLCIDETFNIPELDIYDEINIVYCMLTVNTKGVF